MLRGFIGYEEPVTRDIALVNRQTGELLQVNTLMASLARLRRRVFAWADLLDLLQKELPKSLTIKMITLTYRGQGGWEPNHIRDYMKELKRRLGDKWIAYAWVCEMQQRGEPHYHILMVVPKGTYIPKPDKSGMWKHGLTRIETAKKPGYIAKYAQKIEQKGQGYPKGARKYAVVPNKTYFSRDDIWRFRLSSLPAWLRDEMEQLAKDIELPFPKRRSGGGWLVEETGELLISPWLFLHIVHPLEDYQPELGKADRERHTLIDQGERPGPAMRASSQGQQRGQQRGRVVVHPQIVVADVLDLRVNPYE